MNVEQLNKYIKHYIDEDQTKSAIMISGDWGTGKSYYVKNELTPFLKNNGYESITTSLYGINSIEELSSKIYWQVRTAGIHIDKNETYIATGILIKGLLKNSFLNFTADKRDLQKLYKSINLKNVVLILEDVERSGVDIISVLGYVNDLTENAGVKVILVMNENELINYEIHKDAKSGKDIKKYTENTQKYLSVKEKTISDTMQFTADYNSAIKNIMDNYNNNYLKQFQSDELIEDIKTIMYFKGDWNLRTFMFACQKTVDIFDFLIEEQTEPEFLKCIFYSITAYSMLLKRGIEAKWTDPAILSSKLGLDSYPLLRFCYDYIISHQIEEIEIQKGKKAFDDYQFYSKNKSANDADLKTLSSYYISSEEKVLESLDHITTRLNNKKDISFHEYAKIAYYAIKVSHILQRDITELKELLVNNLKGLGTSISLDYLGFIDEYDEDVKKELNELCNRMAASLTTKQLLFDFTYKPAETKKFYKYCIDNRDEIYRNGAFTKLLDIDKLCELLSQCNPEQIDNIRGAFLSVYNRREDAAARLPDDKNALIELKDKIKFLSKNRNFDRIQELQFSFFISNLEQIIKKYDEII